MLSIKDIKLEQGHYIN